MISCSEPSAATFLVGKGQNPLTLYFALAVDVALSCAFERISLITEL